MNIQSKKNSAQWGNMIKLRERLDTLEALMAAVDGYHHLPIDVLSQFLLDHYTVDLDVLAQFAEVTETGNSAMQGANAFESETAAQSAA
ncbi:hypothetical protein [Qipengyuania citrea]|uniref:hypothetical protein n=2 Tax=Alphaproteobacteria TaxID=28211 RepID=UPI00326629F1